MADDSEEDHIFVAAGDACEICSAMNGEMVSAGFRPHEGCLCQTKRRKKSDDCDPEIDMDFVEVGGVIYATFSVEVTCPNGGKAAAEGSLSEAGFTGVGGVGQAREFLEAANIEARNLASSLCRDCAHAPPGDDLVA